MSNLAHFRALEAQLARYKKELQAIQLQPEFKAELEFEKKLHALLDKHGIHPQTAINILSPHIQTKPKTGALAWQEVTYTNPHTGEVATVRSTNANPVRAWRDQYGTATVKSWGVPV